MGFFCGESMDSLTKIDDKRQMNEFIAASYMVNFLKSCYPAYHWTVCKDSKGGIIKVAEVNLMQTNMPYIIKLSNVEHSEKALRKALVQAGGEILERFHFCREERNHKKVEAQLDERPTDYKGNYLFDAHGVANWIGEKNNSHG